VLYCIDNETRAEPEWARYWTKRIKDRAAEKGKEIKVTEMWDDWDLTAESHRQTFDHPEIYDFVDVSQNNHNKGQKHWDQFLYVRDYLEKVPRPMNTTKIYGADGNKFGHSDQDAIERFWRHLLGGGATVRFHRPDSGLGLSDKAVACLKAARLLEAHVRLWHLDPGNRLLGDRKENEAYLASQTGKAYALFFPAGGKKGERSVTLDLTGVGGTYTGHWVSIDEGNRMPGQDTIEAGRVLRVTPPEEGNLIHVLTRVAE
ncbi:MAG: hypothetical protein AAF514_23085, partial [Verrucomicrobiota bacterium]